MTFGNRRESQFPKHRETVIRNRGLSGWKDSLSGVKSTLDRLQTAQTGRETTRAKQKPKQTRKGGRRFRMLVVLAAVMYGASYFPEHLGDFVDVLRDIEGFVSGKGDKRADKLMEEMSATELATRESTSPFPDNRSQPDRREEAQPPAPRDLPLGVPVTHVSNLPRYSGAEAVFENETVGVYATTDPVPPVADTTFKLLEDAGWHGVVTAQNEEMRHLTFTRGQQEVTAYISLAPGLGDRTSIQYSIVNR